MRVTIIRFINASWYDTDYVSNLTLYTRVTLYFLTALFYLLYSHSFFRYQITWYHLWEFLLDSWQKSACVLLLCIHVGSSGFPLKIYHFFIAVYCWHACVRIYRVLHENSSKAVHQTQAKPIIRTDIILHCPQGYVSWQLPISGWDFWKGIMSE